MGFPKKHNIQAVIENVEFLLGDGLTFDAVAKRVDITPGGLHKLLDREGRTDLIDRLVRNSARRGLNKSGQLISADDQVRIYTLKGIEPDEGTFTLTGQSSILRPASVLRFPGRDPIREGYAEWSASALGILPNGPE